MRNILLCRRTFIAVLSIGCLTALGIYRDIDVSMALASVAVGLAASNAAEGASKARFSYRKEEAPIG